MDTGVKRKSRKTKARDVDGPFHLIREIRKRIRHSNEAHGGGVSPRVKYLWMHVTSNGIDYGTAGSLTTGHWLNVVDEAAALGVQWIVIGWEASPGNASGIWSVCRWAQDNYDCHVGIHLLKGELRPGDVESLLSLNRGLTHVLVDQCRIDSVRNLARHGIDICDADVSLIHRTGTCTLPDDMVCVGPQGKLYTCGLVLGNESFCLGSVFDRAFSHVVTDQSLPHHVPEYIARDDNHHSCNACPPLMVGRLLQDRG